MIRPTIVQALSAVLVVAAAASSHAQPSSDKVRMREVDVQYRIRRTWTVADGLPQVSVNCMTETPDGFLWLGTFGGLARFDGISFEVFTTKTTPALGSNRILSLAVDSRGTLWIGTENGFLSRFDGHRFEQVLRLTEPRVDRIDWIEEAADNELDLYCRNQVVRFDPDSGSVLMDSVEIGPEHRFWTPRRLSGVEWSLVDKAVQRNWHLARTLFQDRNGRYWVGLTGALVLIEKSSFMGFRQYEKDRPATIRSVAGGPGDEFYVRTLDPVGVFWFDPRTDQLTPIPVPRGLNPLTLHTAADGTLWLHNHTSIASLSQGQWEVFPYTESPEQFYREIVTDRSGLTWFNPPGRLVSFDGGSFREEVLADIPELSRIEHLRGIPARWMFVDRSDVLWFTLGPNLCQRNENGFKIVHQPSSELVSHEIRGLTQASDGSIWLASYGGGMARVGEETLDWIDSSEGLPDDNVSQIVDDGSGTLWINTNAGLLSCSLEEANAVVEGDLSNLRFRVYGTAECNSGSPARSGSGLIAMPTTNGLLVVDPSQPPLPSAAPSPQITQVSSRDQTFDLAADVDRPIAPGLGDRDLVFRFTAPWLHDPENAAFEYRMIGLHEEWRSSGSDRHIRFADLRPSRYVFEVRTVGLDGTPNPRTASVALLIPARLHEQLWAQVALALLVLGAGIAIYEWRIALARRYNERLANEVNRRAEAEESIQQLAGSLIHAQEAERSRIARDLHDDLGQRLALASIRAETLAIENPTNPGPAQVIHKDLQSISRDVHRISHSLHPAKLDQLGLVASARAHCDSISTVESVRVEFEADPACDTLDPVSSLCLYRVIQEALHNIVKHSGATTAVVSLQQAEGKVILQIRDNGQGFNAADTRPRPDAGLGLRSMRERVRFSRGSIEIDSTPGTGSTIRVVLPFESAPDDSPPSPSDGANDAHA